MSCSTLYVAGPDGEMKPDSEYRNSWLFGMAIWQYLVNRYLAAHRPESGFWLGDPVFIERLWRLAEDPRVPWIERVCHACTFDRALVRGEERAAVVGAFRSMATLLPQSHLPAMADAIEALAPETRAIGWQVTSVAENLWWVSGEEGGDEDEGRRYHLDRDSDHQWVFDRVK